MNSQCLYQICIEICFVEIVAELFVIFYKFVNLFFSSFIILKCRNLSCYLNFHIDWHEIFFFDFASLQASQNERNLNFLIFISDCESLNSQIISLILRWFRHWCRLVDLIWLIWLKTQLNSAWVELNWVMIYSQIRMSWLSSIWLSSQIFNWIEFFRVSEWIILTQVFSQII